MIDSTRALGATHSRVLSGASAPVQAVLPPLVLSLLAIAGCTPPYEDRAELDSAVGRAAAGGVEFRVAGGLAAVREAAPGRLLFWASAPALDITVVAGATAESEWTIDIHNSMPGSVMVDESGAEIAGKSEQGAPTRMSWSITIFPDSEKRLRIAPSDRDERSPWRFALLSDIQGAIDDLPDFWPVLARDPAIRFILSAGDITANGRRAQLHRLQSELAELPVPFYATLGNHELDSSGDALPYRESFGRGSFHFKSRGVHFTMLDTASATIDPLVSSRWLEEWLAEAADDLHVVACHVPLVDPIGIRNASFASRNEGYKLLAQLARGGVDLLLHGHIHTFHSYEAAGIPAIISGGGGGVPERWDGIGRHYVTIDVDPAGRRIAGTEVVSID